ncbi:MAG: NAD(P)H-hydrate epimerase, partial [Bacteroidales bacterium]|nr:NAD(P)H-hydrate epimerase [Bacteroidales bacterium]
MKIPSIEQIRACDVYTIAHKPISSADLMEHASQTCAEHIQTMFPAEISVAVFCGTGNNGGDGLAVARLLLDSGYDCHAFVVKENNPFSDDCETNRKRLQNAYPQRLHIIDNENDIPALNSYHLLVDALLGSGLNKPIAPSSLLAKIVQQINNSPAFVFAVDMPSGLFAEKPVVVPAVVVEADFVLTFQFPKLSFFFSETYPFVKQWAVADVGLLSECIKPTDICNYMIDDKMIKDSLRPRQKFAHKGDFGHGLLIAGSKGMMGAAVLAAKSCLRTGIGLLTTHIPKTGYSIMQTAVNEAVCACDEDENHFSGVEFKTLNKYNAVGIGPGLGKDKHTAEGLKKLIGDFGGSIVFDADAINILSENKTWLEFIPPDCIFTPHIKEFERLTRPVSNSFERMELQKEFSKRHNCTLVLKGMHTCISSPSG